MYLEYGEREREYLRRRDPALGRWIDRLGEVRREMMPDLFEALCHSIAGQQISSKAHAAVWEKLKTRLGEVTPETVAAAPEQALRGAGLSGRKAGYLKTAADRVLSGELDLGKLREKSDREVAEQLCLLPGVGQWTAEMLLIFSLGRPDVLSFGDFGIRKGLSMVHPRTEINRENFEKYRKRYSPYGSTASLYLWAVAGSGEK